MRNLNLCLFTAVVFFILPTQGRAGETDALNLVPWPRKVEVSTGAMKLSPSSRVVVDDASLQPLAEILAEEVHRATGLRLQIGDKTPKNGDVVLRIEKPLGKDAYRLQIADRAMVSGGDYRAVAMGTVTLLQAIRREGKSVILPRVRIEDSPKFEYSGTMVDVARKAFTITQLKRYVDICRYYKIRYLQLHMTDDQAWVFPSTAFPELGESNSATFGGDKPPVKYKLDELKALVAYADARGVTMVPEFELPGHSSQLRGILPEIFNYKDESGKPQRLEVVNMVSPKTDAAIETLIAEMCDVFRSSPYFHTGGDESVIHGIDTMPETKAFMAEHGLKSDSDVFNAFAHRLHKMVTKHGKRQIVWEGVPNGPKPLPKDVIWMPWVGHGGTAATLVAEGYGVINPPWGVKTLYMDPYWVNNAQLKRDEPLLVGAASILWENGPEFAFPWLRNTGAIRNEPTHNPDAGRDHADFVRRHAVADARLDLLLHGFTWNAQGVMDPRVNLRSDPMFASEAKLTLDAPAAKGKLHYTLDGTEPVESSPVYSAPLQLAKTVQLNAKWLGGEFDGLTFSREYLRSPQVKHDAVGAAAVLAPADPGYFGPGAKGLTDGYLAAGMEPTSVGWVGWDAREVSVTLDLGKPTSIKQLDSHFMRSAGGINLPVSVEYSLSENGTDFKPVATAKGTDAWRRQGWFNVEISPVTARFVRVKAVGEPGWPWLFADEVCVNPQPRQIDLPHAAVNKSVTLTQSLTADYSMPGVAALTDGFVAPTPSFLSAHWLGFMSTPLEATVDLGKSEELESVGGNFLHYPRAGIFLPRGLEVSVSDDGTAFRSVAKLSPEASKFPAESRTILATLQGVKARYVRVTCSGVSANWIFVDEVIVNPKK